MSVLLVVGPAIIERPARPVLLHALITADVLPLAMHGHDEIQGVIGGPTANLHTGASSAQIHTRESVTPS
jgi:hypothetical protein